MADGPADELLVAAMAWGFGLGYGLSRTRKMLEYTGPDLQHRLEAIRDSAITDAGDGYDRIWDQKTHVWGLRTAMGTKFLYFAAFHRGQGRRPLILDRFVLNGLRAAGVETPTVVNRVTRDEYLSYIETAVRWADRRDLSDAVEYDLFREGRTIQALTSLILPALERASRSRPPSGARSAG
jgi:hypothetical protein